jgi:hypothetical protein
VSLIDGPVTIPAGTTGYVTASVETAGFSRIGILVEGDVSWLDTRIEWGWGGTPERFGSVDDRRDGIGSGVLPEAHCQLQRTGRSICPVSGDRVRLAIDNPYDPVAHFTALGIYLIP